MINKNENIEMENKKDKLSQQQLEKVTGGVNNNGQGGNKEKSLAPLPWSPDEEPDNSGHL